jgi:glycosyltransferase involved in cell wall biosynthesis
MICVDCRYIRERPSGIGPIVGSIVRWLPGWMPEEHFMLLRHPKAPGRLSTAPNTHEVVVPQEANGPATLLWLPRVVDLRGVELYFTPSNILPAGLRMASVVTVCDVMWITHPRWASGPGAWGLAERLFYGNGIWRALREASHVVTISDASRREILQLAPEVDRRLSVIHEGVSAEDFHPVRDAEEQAAVERVRRRFVPGAERYVLTVGQFAPYKNHANVVKAFARAFDGEPSVHLVLVQRLGEGMRVLGPLARSLGLAERLHVLQGLTQAELRALYQGAACLCHPSLMEGFGNAPSEALAAGTPVVTSNCSSMPEVSADAAEYVSPQDPGDIARALRKVLGSVEVAAGMRERGLRRARELSWEAMVRGYERVFREVLAGARSSSARGRGRRGLAGWRASAATGSC